MKIWSKLFLVAATGMMMFSSCLENIEPEGIADLRGAKAELLRAQTAFEAARAAKMEADAALVLAQAKVQEAIAKQEEAKVAYEEARALKAQYEAEAVNIQNEEDRAALEQKIAEVEAAIAQAKLDAELYALQLQEDILKAEAAAIAAQQEVDQALRDLAVAKATLTANEQAAISALETAVTIARDAVEEKTKDLHDAATALARAIAEIDETGHSTMIASLEQAVVVAQAALDAEVEAEAEAKALLEVDKTLVDWDAKREEMEADLDSMDRAMIAVIEKYNAAAAEVETAYEAIDDKVDEYESITGYNLDFDTTGYPTEWGTGLFSNIQGTPTETIDVPDVQIKNEVLGDFTISGETYTYGEEDVIVAMFDDEVAGYAYDLNWYKYYDDYWNEWNASEVAKMEKDPEHVAAMEKHAAAADAVKTGKYLDYFKKYVYTEDNGFDPDFDIEESIADYNKALSAFEKGIADYEAEEARLTKDQAAYEEIDAAETAAENAALAEQTKGYQDIESKYRAAKSVYEKAKSVNDAAIYKRDREIEKQIGIARTAADDPALDEADIVAFETAYMDATATDEEKTLHATYEKVLEAIQAARDAYDDPDATVKTDPATIWANAGDAWIDAQAKYTPSTGTAYAEVDATYADRMEDIAVKYDAIWADFYAKYPNFDQDYRNYWTDLLDDLRTALQIAAYALETPVIDYLLVNENEYSDINNSVNVYKYDGTSDGEHPLNVTDVAWFLTDGEKFVPVTFDGLLDKDFFASGDEDYNGDWVDGQLFSAANDLWYYVKVVVDFEDGTSDYDLYADECVEYPAAHMTYERFCEMFEAKVGLKYDEIEDVEWTLGTGTLIDYYLTRWEAEFYVAQSSEHYAAIPDHVKAVEAAKAEFVAYVAEKEAELAAMKAEIEKTVAEYLKVALTLYEEYAVEQAKYEVLEANKSMLVYIIEQYIATYHEGAGPAPETLEAFEDALETAYNATVTARIDAEKALAEAKWAVEEAKAGNLNAVEIAQLQYDRAAEELAEAMAALDKATADLKAMLEIIYGETEETPAE